MLFFFVLCLVAARAEGTEPDWENKGLHAEDYNVHHNLHRRSNKEDNPSFEYVFVDARGSISRIRGKPGTKIEVVRSPLASDRALKVAADVTAKMTKYMPDSIFKKLAMTNSVGVFTATEKLTIFPEYKYLANGKCGSRCTGSCSKTCTNDGRKWENIAGIGGIKAGILDDNLLCTVRDPYHRSQNMLALEFAHTIYDYALSDEIKKKIKSAYKKAKQRITWGLSSVAMEAEDEYFAESTTSFFHVSLNSKSSGGMNVCDDELCSSLQATRKNIRRQDPALYNILSYVYTNNRPYLSSSLTICP